MAALKTVNSSEDMMIFISEILDLGKKEAHHYFGAVTPSSRKYHAEQCDMYLNILKTVGLELIHDVNN